MSMKKLFLSTIVATVGLVGLNNFVHAADLDPIDADVASYPIYASLGAKPPLIMLLLGRDHSMYYEAYNDLTDLDDDGNIDGVFTPHVVYDGIFESNWCYKYESGVFNMNSLATSDESSKNGNPVYKCGNHTWSGNFLNYLTSTRMDIVKRILIGGQRFTNMGYCKNNTQSTSVYKTCRDDNKYPILARQYIPHDTHGWAKMYNSEDINLRCKEAGYSCKLSDWADVNDDSAMFGSVGRQLYVVRAKDIQNDTMLPMGSYTKLANGSQNDKNAIFVWNWIARESSANGANGYAAKGPLSIAKGKTAMNKPGVNGNNGHFSVTATSYNVLAQSCHYEHVANATMPSRCKKYGTSSDVVYNTVGLLHDFSKEGAVDAYFGLITSIWNTDKNNLDAKKDAALRSPISDLSKSSQIDGSNGNFKENSVYALINMLSVSQNEGTPTSTAGGNTSTAWSDCKINSANTDTIAARGCSDWGNPIVPLIQKSYEYFSNTASTGGTADKLSVKRFTDDQSRQTYDYPRLDITENSSPYTNGSLNLDYCFKPINFILADESVSMDYDTSLTNISDENLTKGFTIIKELEGDSFLGKHVFGEFTGTKKIRENETLHTLKNVDSVADLLNVRGVSTLEPNVQGSLKGAALAAYIHRNPLKFTFNTETGAKEKNVPGFEHFAVAMASYLPQFEVYNKRGKKILIVPTCKAPRNTLSGKFDIVGGYAFDKGDGYSSNCAIADVFYVNSSFTEIDGVNRLTSLEFRVTYEDNEAGSDFDMDALFTYKIQADSSNPDLIDVSITGFYHDTYAAQLGGYSIFGTSGVITPNYSNCSSTDGTCEISSSGYVVDAKKSYYLDVMKVTSSASNFFLMINNSDPYNEYNNVSNLADGTTLSAVDSRLTDKVVITEVGDRDTDHRYGCHLQNNENGIYGKIFKKSGYAIKFLPAFASSCSATVSRKFFVTGFDDNSGFYDSPLDYAAYYGSSYGDDGSKGKRKANNPNYFYVTNASKLASQITAALTQAVGTGGNSGTGMAFPTLDAGADDAIITATYDTLYWTGQLHRSTLQYNDDGSIKVVTSSSESTEGAWAGDHVSFDSDSKVLIADKNGSLTQLKSGENLLTDPSTASKYPLSSSIIDLFGMSECGDDSKKTLIEKYVAYVVDGDGTWEYSGDEGNFAPTSDDAKITCGSKVFYGFHPRSANNSSVRTLGAIINSTPQYYEVGGKRKLIFAANDGMVHIVDQESGHVDFSIIPYVSQDTMPKYAMIGNQDHYINDGRMTISEYNVKLSDNTVEKHVLAIGTLGSVHPGMYAFDLTDSNNPKMLWELSPYYTRDNVDERVRNMAYLGGVQAKIAIVPYSVKDGTTESVTVLLAIFGNGYNSVKGIAGVGVVNALTGKVESRFANDPTFKAISKGGVLVNAYGWTDPDCNRQGGSMYVNYKDPSGACYKNGMNQIVTYDRNSDFKPDYVYSTDLYGNVYRISATNNGSGNSDIRQWRLAHILTTISPDRTKVQPITTAPVIGQDANGKPMVIVGTGKYLGASDLKTGDIQSVWGLSDKSFNTASDYTGDSTSLVGTSADLSSYRSAKLYYSRMYTDTTGDLPEGFRNIEPSVENTKYNVDIYDGWVTDFYTVNTYGISERIKNNMTLLDNHLYVTTMTPSSSVCDGGGSGHFYDLNVQTSTFYKTAEKSQMYSTSIFNEMTVGWASENSVSGKRNPGGTEDPEHPCEGEECNNIDPYDDVHNYCLRAYLGNTTSKNDNYIGEGEQYCPRVESWQFIYN